MDDVVVATRVGVPAAATMDATATVYTATGEVSGAGYSAGGVDLTGATDWVAPATTGTTAYTTPTASFVYTAVTLTTANPTTVSFDPTDFPSTGPTIARFTVSPTNPTINQDVTFNGTSSTVSNGTPVITVRGNSIAPEDVR